MRRDVRKVSWRIGAHYAQISAFGDGDIQFHDDERTPLLRSEAELRQPSHETFQPSHRQTTGVVPL